MRNNQGESPLSVAKQLGQGTQVAMMRGTYVKPSPAPALSKGKVTSDPASGGDGDSVDLIAIEADGAGE